MAHGKGFFFSLDATMAAILLVTGLILASSFYVRQSSTTTLVHYSDDLVSMYSSLKLYELNSSAVDSLVAAGVVTDLNKTFLDTAAYLWAEGNINASAQILNLSTGIFPPSYKYGIYFGNELVLGSNESPAGAVISSKRLISGISKGKPVEGFSSQAQLTSFQARNTYAYAYLGGFAGQGNITTRLALPVSLVNVTNASMELSVSGDFVLYINDVFSGNYARGSGGGAEMLADKWVINDSYLRNFVSGVNYFDFIFNSSLSYIGGGYVKVGYATAGLDEMYFVLVNNTATGRYYFPGIAGMINIYDSFYVPGNLSSMAVHLRYNSSFNTFLTIGNVTVFSLNSQGIQIIDLANSSLAAMLDYAAISSRTVPVRLGSGTGNATTIGTGNADVVLANDLSGSMEFCSQNECSTIRLGPVRYCGTNGNYRPETGTYCNWTTEDYNLPDGGAVCSTRWHALCPANDTRKIDIAINASRLFTSTLLGTLGNRMGMVGYTNPWNGVIPAGGQWSDQFAPFPDGIVSYINLTNNATLVGNSIAQYMDTYWGTCICCGILSASNIINNMSSPDRYKSIVIMSDGEATDKCTGVGTGNAKADAIQAAQNACNDYNISVNTVGFGSTADTDTLKAMTCLNGSFYNVSNLADLISAYNQIANNINTVSYKQQAINYSGAFPSQSVLFDDSYIEYNYTPAVVASLGFIPVTLQTPAFGNNLSELDFNLAVGFKLAQASVTSFSSSHWTDNLTVSNSVPNRQAFALSGFGSNYSMLGDPFVVYARPDLFVAGNNLVHVSTGDLPGNTSGGSPDDAIVYTLLIPNSVAQTGAFNTASGCVWYVSFEDGTGVSMPVPASYSGSQSCYFSPANYSSDDAVDDAVYRLLSLLDFNGNGKLDVKFSAGDIDVRINTLSNVPSLWGPAVAEVRVWQ